MIHRSKGVSAAMNENKEYITHPDEMGCIHISEDVVCAVAASAAAEVDGVSAMMNASGKKGASRGVLITVAEDKAAVDVYLIVRYGQPIPEVAENVQCAVASAVEAMTGLTVGCVNVHVGGVSFE